MARHSKSKNTGMWYNPSERAQDGEMAKGSITKRLAKDSQKDVTACTLCLQPVKDPLVCGRGHLFCRECILSNLLAQKQEIKRKIKAYESQTKGEKIKAAEKEADVRQKALGGFTQLEDNILPQDHRAPQTREEKLATTTKNLKMTHDERYRVRQAAIRLEKEEIAERGLTANYWLPTNAPEAEATKLAKPFTGTVCPALNKTDHPVKLKHMTAVHFTGSRDARSASTFVDAEKYICPCCLKAVNNTMEVMVLETCGHAVCRPCGKKFLSADAHDDEHRHKKHKSGHDDDHNGKADGVLKAACPSCGKVYTEKQMIRLVKGGTGFSGHDEQSETKKALPFTMY